MDFDFQASDFKKLMFPIENMPTNIDPVKHFPRLAKYPEFISTAWSKERKNKVFRYIVFMYDKESPFNPRMDDLNKKKIEVAKYVKLIENPKEVPDDIKAILRNENEKVNAMIVAYCRMQCNPLWSLVVGLNERYYTELEAIRNQNASKNVSISALLSELQKATTDLLTQDNSPQLLKEFFEYLEEERISDLRPEGIAEIFTQGKKPLAEMKEDIDYE